MSKRTLNKDSQILDMFEAKIYKIAVLSLRGIMEEVYAAKQTILQWMSSISNSLSPSFPIFAGNTQTHK